MKTRSYALIFLISLTFGGLLNAQDKEKEKELPKRPDNISVSEFDDFKNSSFDIMDNAVKLKADFSTIDNEVKKYSGVINTIKVDKLRKDFLALRGIKNETTTLSDRISKLDDQGKSMVTNAKNVTPKLKSLSATKNTDKAIKGLSAAKDNLGAVTSALATDITLITDELKKRKEPIE